jgi:Mn-dependent DtxR family transcriptional regulator
MELKLTPSQENYLEHIWRISSNGSVRAVNLADSVGVKRPSVTRAINTLSNLGLVQHQHYGDIELTAKGCRAAKYIVYRDQCLKRFMTQVLQFDAATAEEEVCRLEHAVSERVMHRLEALSNYISSNDSLRKALSQFIKKQSLSGQLRKAENIGIKPHI